MRTTPTIALVFLLASVLAGSACNAIKAEEAKGHASTTARSTDSLAVAQGPANVVRVYVSAVNCEMNGADALRLNAIALTAGLEVEVVFFGISAGDSLVVVQAKADLGLTVPVRQVRGDELKQYKSIGAARMPMAVVIKARQLKTLIAGESMPRTMSLLETAMSPSAGA